MPFLPSDTPRRLRALVAELGSLVFPEACAGCGGDQGPVCGRCRASLVTAPVLRDIDGTPVWSGTTFDGPVAPMLRTAKERARPRLARALAPALRTALAALASTHRGVPLVVVPVPSSPSALRARGFRLVEVIAREAGVAPRSWLGYRRTPGDQRGLDRRARRGNVAGAMVARPAARRRTVVIVDDVVTTGATIREAARALTAGGALVVGAAAVASTSLTHVTKETQR